MYKTNRRWEFYVSEDELESLRDDWQQARVHCHEFGRRDVTKMKPRDIITYVNKDNLFDRYHVRAGDVFAGSPYFAMALATGVVEPEHCVPRSAVEEFKRTTLHIDGLVSKYFAEDMPEERKFDTLALMQHIQSSLLYDGGNVVVATLKGPNRSLRAA